MSFFEYILRRKAWELQKLDREYIVAKQAWRNREIEAKNREGTRLVYTTFTKFFDYEKRENEILGRAAKDSPQADTPAARYAEYMRKKKDG